MEDEKVALDLKAEVLCSGTLYIPEEIKIPFPASRSSAGPGAGNTSIVICFSGIRAKIPISRRSGELELRKRDKESYEILKNGKPLVTDVTLLPTLCHAPGQAFVSIGRSCKMNCLFCTINEAGSKSKGDISVDTAFKLIESVSKKPDFHAVAITSGIGRSIEDQIEHMADLVSRVRKRFPEIPIGVEPLITSKYQLMKLKEAGATEVKVNLEAATRDIFKIVCPARDYDITLESIRCAVAVFGKGKVTSNIIVGFGETDDDVGYALEMLAHIGSVGNIRAIRLNKLNFDRLTEALGRSIGIDKNRLISLAKMQKQILERHGLSTKEFKTMCFPCGCCDLVPGIDF